MPSRPPWCRRQGREAPDQLVAVRWIEIQQHPELVARGVVLIQAEQGPDEELARLEVEGIEAEGIAAGRDGARPVAFLEAERGQVGAVRRAPGVDRDGAPARGDGV